MVDREPGDTWCSCTIKSIYYKAFTPSVGFSRELLLRTETAMLNEDSRRLVTRTSKEIFTFVTAEGEPPEPPSTFRMSLSRKGTLKPPYSVDASDDNILDIFVTALQQACRCQLLRVFPCSFTFSSSSVLHEDSLIHCVPTVQANGEVLLRLFEEKTSLKPFKIGDDYGIVWLIPGGRPARVVGSSPPMPGLAQVWWDFMKASTFYRGQLHDIEASRWVHVACDGHNLLWPLVLTKTAARPMLEWKPLPPLREAVSRIRAGIKRPLEDDPPAKPSVRFSQHPVAPPPSPLPTSNLVLGGVTSIIPPPALSRQPLTPAGLPPQYPTPTYHSSPDYDYDENDELENVTNNDFDFYDQPLHHQISHDQPPHDTSQLRELQQSPAPASPASQRSFFEHSTEAGLYTALQFDSRMLSIDSKYLEGGRYHISSPYDIELDDAASSLSGTGSSDSQNEGEQRVNEELLVGRPRVEEIKIFFEEWASVLWPEPYTPQGIPATSYTQELMAQIVWDGGNLRSVANEVMLDEPASPAMDMVVTAVGTVVPDLRKANIEDEHQIAARLLCPPLYLFRRSEMSVKARASILQFWRTFGLRPYDGPRDITCVILTLEQDGEAQEFAMQLKSSYEACGLGKCDLPNIEGSEIRNGVFEIVADILHSHSSGIIDSFEVACSMLRRILTEKLQADSNLLLLMATPPKGLDRMPLQPLSRGFQTLMGAFLNAKWFLTTTEVFDMPSQHSLDRISMLIYDRWADRLNYSLSSDNSKTKGQSVFRLAHLAPKMIGLQYTPDPPSQVVEEEPVIHVAYAFSPDRRWIAVAWTDPWATNTKVEAFRVGLSPSGTASRPRANSPTPNSSGKQSSFECTASEIARVTSRFLVDGTTSVIITKCGLVDPKELEEWKRVFPNVSVLQLPHPRGLAVKSTSRQIKTSDPPEPDSVVVSVDDEVRGIVHDSYAILYRGEKQLEIDWLYGNKRDMTRSVAQFRRLASWAIATGITQSSILPWHVAAVNKMAAALVAL